MRRIWRLVLYARPYALYSLVSVLLMAIVGAMAGLRIYLIKPIFLKVLRPDDQSANFLLFRVPWINRQIDLHFLVPSHFQNAWTVVAYALVASAVVKSICDYAGTYLINYAGFGMITDLRNDLYDAILRRSVAFFQKHATGVLLSTIINDIEKVQFAMSTIMADFLQQFFTLLAMTCVAISFGGKLAWVMLLFVPVVISSARRIGRSVRTTTRTGQDKLAEIQNILHETITGNGIVKAFGMELWEMDRFRRAARRLFHANLRSVSVQAISSPLMDAVGSIGIALLLYLGRKEIQHGGMTLGDFVGFIVAVFSLYDPVRKFALFYNSFQQALGASEEIFRFMDAQDDVVEKKRAQVVRGFKESIQFEDVGFAYESDGEVKPVLHGIDLDVRRGEVIAVVGPSGAGKSSLLNLIPRFFDVSDGRILIDGCDVRDVTLASLRTQIGKVTQETILFNDTVRNNIAYGQPDVPLARVEEAARMALAHDFILRMPDGYDTMIGEKGVRLSGGERQRLAIARAILKNAPILILDEATSALDTESEAFVQAALANLMQGRTVFVIAHRMSTVRRATRIVVLEAGRITESGTHEELMVQSGTYRRLYDLQFADEFELSAVDVAEAEDVGRGAVSELKDQVVAASVKPIYSMTGFASEQGATEDGLAFTLTLKSVNHRFLDLNLRLPGDCDALEVALRRLIKDWVRRGHLDMTLHVDRRVREVGQTVSLNRELLAAHMDVFHEAAKLHHRNVDPDLHELLRMPGVVSAEAAASGVDVGRGAALEAAVMALAPELLERLNGVRAAEGAALAAELRASMGRLRGLAEESAELRVGAREVHFERLRGRIGELLSGGAEAHDSRLLAEAALLVERSDIDEELVRLRAHIESFVGMLDAGGELGKRLDFLLQELNREANTLLSKTTGGDAGIGLRMTAIGLEMKTEIERTREQVQNLE